MSNKWKSVLVNYQNIIHETSKAVLVQVPHKAKYGGFQFWVSKKLVRDNGGWQYKISFTDDFKFSLKKMGSGKYNYKEVIQEVEVDSEEFESIFKCHQS